MGIAKHIFAVAGLVFAVSLPVLAECRLEPGPRRTVTRVIDGETLLLDDGSEVRLAGALAPRGFDVATEDRDWPAALAATEALAAFTVGRNVALGYSGTAKRDRQNRHVAQVFVIEEGREIWVQGRLLSEGHARAYQQKDQRGCADELLEHEAVARGEQRGVWGIEAYRARPALRTRDLVRMAGKFVVLSGRIQWVAPGREAIAVGFTPSNGRSWSQQRGVVVMIEGRDRELLGAFGGNAKALEGRQVEVRGWLEQRLGRSAGTYVMDVSLAGMIQVLDWPAKTVAVGAAANIAAANGGKAD